jgi:DnaJ-class molecular chaperone
MFFRHTPGKINHHRSRFDMPQVHSHYENLKVARDAPLEVIRAAYRVLAQKYHPDRNPGDVRAERRMKLINEAYAVLSDSSSRHAHDQWIQAEESNSVSPEQNNVDNSPPESSGRSRRDPSPMSSDAGDARKPEVTKAWKPKPVADPNAIDLDIAWARFKYMFTGSRK